MKKLSVLISAAFGGISPNLLNLGISLTKGGTLPEWTYIIGLMVFAILGAGVAAVWKETDLKRAFYLGIGLPTLIQLNVNSVYQQDYTISSIDKTAMFTFVSTVNAQDLNPIEGRKIEFIVPNQSIAQYDVVFLSRDSSKKLLQKINIAGRVIIDVPDFASFIVIGKGFSKSAKVRLPQEPNTIITIEVSMKKKKWSGFLQSIGIRRVPTYTINLKIIKIHKKNPNE